MRSTNPVIIGHKSWRNDFFFFFENEIISQSKFAGKKKRNAMRVFPLSLPNLNSNIHIIYIRTIRTQCSHTNICVLQ